MKGVALILLAAAAALAGGCGMRLGGFGNSAVNDVSYENTAAVPATTTSRLSIASSKPVDAYVQLGGRIKSCWFNATDPLLPDHVYRANVSPDGNKVQITIHEKMKLGRAGLSTYAVDFRQEGSGTVVTTENRKMPPELAAKMQYDIDRWKRGESDCNKVMPPVTAAAPQASQ